MQTIVHWLELHLMPCFYKKYLGVECPGCGMQRAFIELLKGNLWQSILTYPPLLPTIFMLIFLALHLKFKFLKGATILKISFIFTSAITIFNYILKFI